tara:strand:- start:15489 stop:16214 length:726 start_codon:yes stop_codon:yes gene_type:complete
MVYFRLIFVLFCISFLSNAQIKKEFSYNHIVGKSNYFLNKEPKHGLIPKVADSFDSMKAAAKLDGIEIIMISGYRSFNDQKNIWNKKFLKNELNGFSVDENIKKIIEYSTIPGTSRHHWGTDIDIVDGSYNIDGDVLITEKFYGNGPYVKLRKWLDKNSHKYGFYQVYTNDKNRNGFKHEPWHYSYAPISIDILNLFLELDLKKIFISNKIMGASYLDSVFIKKYKEEFVLGINSYLKIKK